MRRWCSVILPALILVESRARPLPPAPPTGPERCDEGTPVPPAPRRPRTVEQLGAWALTAERAARQTERARTACANEYARLRSWVETVR